MKVDITKFQKIKFLLFDLEGVLATNVHLASIENQDQILILIKEFNEAVHKLGYKFGIITARIRDRFIDKLEKLNLDEVVYSSIDKITPVNFLLQKHNLVYENLLYVGDEILDVPLMQKCGFSMCPADAQRSVKRIADIHLVNSSDEDVLHEILKIIECLRVELA